MYDRYSLTLMLTHDCNLRCSYCYMGAKSGRVMPEGLGRKAIDRAIASLDDKGELELGFFGGEPLLEPDLLGNLITYARLATLKRGITLRMGLTTNGTIDSPEAWEILADEALELAVSCDGLEGVHDRHRRYADGRGSWQTVTNFIKRLMAAGRQFRVISVVRPDTLDGLCASALYFRSLGVRHFEPSLDLWTQWSDEDESKLEGVVGSLADIWRDGLPNFGIGWFDEKALHLARLRMPPATRCGFGNGAVAVAPSGNLYPCERLIGPDLPDSAMRIFGNAGEGDDFVNLVPGARTERDTCSACAMEGMCNTLCRCSNYTRTGDTRRPDRLLCRWNQACLDNTARILKQLAPGGELIEGAPI